MANDMCPLNALIPEIPFSCLPNFGSGSPPGPGVSLGRIFTGGASIEPFFWGGGGEGSGPGVVSIPAPHLKARPPLPRTNSKRPPRPALLMTAGSNATDDRAFAEAQGLVFQSFSPLCGPCCLGAPASCTYNRDLIAGPLVTGIGQKYGRTGAQVALRWQVQQGIPVIPKSHSRQHLRDNIDLFDWELSPEDMRALSEARSPPVTGGGDGLTSGDCAIP